MSKERFTLDSPVPQPPPSSSKASKGYPKWNFPRNDYGQINGIADSGVETFRSTPIKSLAREICQNSVDAQKDSSRPVMIEFKTFTITSEQIPDVKNLKAAFNKSFAFWSSSDALKAKTFFKKALSEFDNPTITCLRISDHNTKGLTGSGKGQYNTPWQNLIKSSGSSGKHGNSGGSYGIGKYAPFACSLFRTVFYSTLDVAGISASQGISRITSFPVKKDLFTQGVGYFGNARNTPIYEQFSLDSNYHRDSDDTGTDVFILGFMGDQDWQNQLIASILDGFLYTIYSGTLVVQVNDIELNQENLAKLVEDYKDYCTEHAEEYYKVLTSKDSRQFSMDFPYAPAIKGKLTLWLLFNTTFHRRVAMIRTPIMKIKDKRFQCSAQYAGVLLIEGESLGNYLRDLENPQHLEWDLERAENKRTARAILLKMDKFIRDSLNSMMNDGTEEELDPEVGEFLALPMEDTVRKNPERTEGIFNKIRTLAVQVSRFISNPTGTQTGFSGETDVDDEEGELDLPDTSGSGHGRGKQAHGGGIRDGSEYEGDGEGNLLTNRLKSSVPIAPINVRSAIIDKAAGLYRILFVPSTSASNGYLDIFMSAEAQTYDAPIKAAKSKTCRDFTLKGNRISRLAFTERRPVVIDITLDYHDYCSMEIKAYGNQS